MDEPAEGEYVRTVTIRARDQRGWASIWHNIVHHPETINADVVKPDDE